MGVGFRGFLCVALFAFGLFGEARGDTVVTKRGLFGLFARSRVYDDYGNLIGKGISGPFGNAIGHGVDPDAAVDAALSAQDARFGYVPAVHYCEDSSHECDGGY